jgi:hypothetical protein
MPTTSRPVGRRRRTAPILLAAGLVLPLLAGPVSAQEQEAPRPICTEAVPPAVWLADRRDVPQVHRPAVDCAAFLSIVRGTPTSDSRTELRPADVVTRAAMASFVARTLLVAGVPLPPPSEERFDDVEGSVHEESVHRLRAAGIVSGRTSTSYAPHDPVTRAQTASLLLRAAAHARGADAADLERDDSPFDDVGDSVHRRAIGGAFALGLVRGVTETRYAPRDDTTRAQMASVLVRALESEAQPVRACTNDQDEYTVFPPADWAENDGTAMPPCSAFDPEPFQLEPASDDTRRVAIVVKDEPVTYEEALTSDREAVVTREDTLLLGPRRAARQERVATGEDGLRPEGERYTLWFVDRGDHTLIGETNDAGDKDYETNRGVLTRMLLSLLLPEPDPMAFSSPESVETSPSGPGDLGLAEIRTGLHDGYDRVVIELDGDGTAGWRVAYTDDPRYQGTGDPVERQGDATLQIHVDGVGYPHETGVPPYDGPDRVAGPGESVYEVVVGNHYEARQGAFAGTREALPFRVFRLADPERVVIDVAHRPAG